MYTWRGRHRKTCAAAAAVGLVVATDAPREVAPGLRVSGPAPRATPFEDTGGAFFLDEDAAAADLFPDDQAVFFDTADGLVLLVGCAHAGVVNTMRHVAALAQRDRIHAVIGGMHLLRASVERLARTAAAFDAFHVDRVIGCHCTGDAALARLAEALPGRVNACHAGETFAFA